jgi:hypothetical protein
MLLLPAARGAPLSPVVTDTAGAGGRSSCPAAAIASSPAAAASSTAVSIVICVPRVTCWRVVRLRTAPQRAGAAAAPAACRRSARPARPRRPATPSRPSNPGCRRHGGHPARPPCARRRWPVRPAIVCCATFAPSLRAPYVGALAPSTTAGGAAAFSARTVTDVNVVTGTAHSMSLNWTAGPVWPGVRAAALIWPASQVNRSRYSQRAGI